MLVAARSRSRRVPWSALLSCALSCLGLDGQDLGANVVSASAAAQDLFEAEKEHTKGSLLRNSEESQGTRGGELSGASEGERMDWRRGLPQRISRNPPQLILGAGPHLLKSPMAFAEAMNREVLVQLASQPGMDLCDPWEDYLNLRRTRRELKYNSMHSPAYRLYFLRALEETAARCPPAHEGSGKKRKRFLTFTWSTLVFHHALLGADLFQHGKVVLTPRQVVRYRYSPPVWSLPVGRNIYEDPEGSFIKEDALAAAKYASTDPLPEHMLDLLELDADRPNTDFILRGPNWFLGKQFDEWDDDPARDGDLEKLRAEDPEVERQMNWYEEHVAFAKEQKTVLNRDHLYWIFFDQTEAEVMHFLEHLEAVDELLPADQLPPVEEAETFWDGRPTVVPARPLPAEVSDEALDWEPKVRATVKIPYAAYPVVPAAARQRHWLTVFSAPIVTGRDAKTKEPIVQFLRLVNTRPSRKTELLKLLLHDVSAVLSKNEFERIVDPDGRPYLKWFLTVKHPNGAPEEYLQELQRLDDWRKGCVWACGSIAVLQLLLISAGSLWVLRLSWKNKMIRRRISARRNGSCKAASTPPCYFPIGYTQEDHDAGSRVPLTADTETATFGRS